MLCRKYIILAILLSVIVSQVQFSRIAPTDYYLGDARSMGMGNSIVSNCRTSILSLSNPAGLSDLNNSIYFQSSFSSIFERRSIVITDMWGDFLANADYVFNDNSYLKNSFGFNYTLFPLNEKIRTTVAFSYMPFSSFNYSYEEEVRSDADLEDGIIGIDDPIIGFHVLRNTGDVYVGSLGFSCSFNRFMSIGVGINQLQEASIKDEVYIDIVDNTAYSQNNLSNVENHEDSFLLEKTGFITLSLKLKKDDISIVGSFEQDALIKSKTSSSFHISDQLGLPIVFDLNDGIMNYNIEGLSYQKPSKYNIGILYEPKYNSDFSIVFETTKKTWNHNTEYGKFLDNKVLEYRFGFEYAPVKGFPVRAGLVYSESPFLALGPKTTLTLGTGKIFNKTVLDLAMNYNTVSYMHHDLFPSENTLDLSCDEVGCDTVKENNLIFLATLRYNF